MQSNDKSEPKGSSKKAQNKPSGHNAIEMKPHFAIDLINSSKTSPNKSSITSSKTADKKNEKSINSVNTNTNQNSHSNKRSKGAFNQIKARLNLHSGGQSSHQSISSLRPTHVFAGRDTVSANTATNDITDVRQMENTLLTLLEDFHSGKLQAFGQDITFEKMESVREQQERLARLHFDLNLQQEVYGHQTEEGKRLAKDNMAKLIENLQQLSNSIEQLQSRSSVTNHP